MSIKMNPHSNGSLYQVQVQCLIAPPLEVLVQDLQSAYDNGADGSFEVSPVDKDGGTYRTITFTRDAAEDAEYVQVRMVRDQVVRELAACQQLAAELEYAKSTAAIGPILQTLKANAGAAVVSSVSPGALDLFGGPGAQGIADAKASQLEVAGA